MPRILLTALVLAAACAAPACAQSEPAIAAGVRVGGVDVGGLTAPAAAARVQDALGARAVAPLELRVGAHRLHLTRRGGGLALDATASAQAALAANGATEIEPVVRFDPARLDAFLDRVQRAGTREPRDARLRYTVTRLKVARARDGLRVDRAGARAQIEAALLDPAGPRVLRVRLRHIKPDVTAADVARRHPVVVTIHRRGFRLRLFADLKAVASYPVAVGMPGHETPARALHDRQQGRRSGLERARPAVGGRLPQRGGAGRQRREPAQGALARDRRRRRHPRHRRALVARHRRVARLYPDVGPGREGALPARARGGAGHDQVSLSLTAATRSWPSTALGELSG